NRFWPSELHARECALAASLGDPGLVRSPATSQILIDLSSQAVEASRLPSGLQATPQTCPRWPRKAIISDPVSASQIRTAPSHVAVDASRFPSGLQATAQR